MRYHRFEQVLFKGYDGKERQGKIVEIEYGKNCYWIAVKEHYNYLIPIEPRGRILGWTRASSPVIEHYVPLNNIISKIEQEKINA